MKVELGDCMELVKALPDKSIDCVIIDPPYTDGKRNVLDGHKIQTVLDVEAVVSEAYRVLKKDAFFAFFGQMPTILTWYNAAIKAGFDFRIDIIWAKRQGGQGGNLQLKRSHETIFVFSKGSPNYNKTKGEYNDVSQSLCEAGLKDISSVFRQLAFWKARAQGRDVKSHWVTKGTGLDDYFSTNGGLGKSVISQKFGSNDVSFNSVWSFLSHNRRHTTIETGAIKHPTVKSVPLLERLVELLSKEGDTVLDMFGGSGTTGIACIRTKRDFILFELHQEYYDIINSRIEKEFLNEGLFNPKQSQDV